MVGRIARRLFQSDLLGAVAAALLAFEGHHFVHSRTGLLDIFVMFFGLAAFGALLIDRDQAREVLAASGRGVAGVDQPVGGSPWLAVWRWSRRVLGGGRVKWSGLFLIFFGLLTVLWDLRAPIRRRARLGRRWRRQGRAVRVRAARRTAFVPMWPAGRAGSSRVAARSGPGRDAAVRRARRPAPDWWRSLWA